MEEQIMIDLYRLILIETESGRFESGRFKILNK